MIRCLRYSLDKSTRELLYLPLAARVKIQVKWFIDTVIWRLGDGLSGLAVLIFATTLHYARAPNQLGGAGAGQRWLVSVAIVRTEYVATLKESISQHRVDVEQAYTSVLDRSTTELLASSLTASDPKDILYALSLFEVERQRAAHPVIRSLLSHPSAEVRQKAIQILVRIGGQDGAPGHRTADPGSRSQCTHRSLALPDASCARRPARADAGRRRLRRLLSQFGGGGISGATRRNSNTGGRAADSRLHGRRTVAGATAASGGSGPLAGRTAGLLRSAAFEPARRS